jgi:Methyltransferase domain
MGTEVPRPSPPVAGWENPPGPLRLNLGAGGHPLEGYANLDRKTGQEVYPLDGIADGSVEEIRASHVLEHFSHREVGEVLKHWAAKLAPGGLLKIAVPDFEYCAREYLAGKPIPVQSYVMGDHRDGDYRHGAIFDREALAEALADAGLERIGPWASDAADCSSLPVSLNLMAYKPVGGTDCQSVLRGVQAVLSAPRFGPVMHFRLAAKGLFGIPYQVGQGAYWHQVLTELLETAIGYHDAEPEITNGCELVLTLDYDTVFSPADVRELVRLARCFPEAHAICALQEKRYAKQALFGMTDKSGQPRTQVPRSEFNRHLTPIRTGHFGLTLLRASCLRQLPRPWFRDTPDKDGGWGNGKKDADIAFWDSWHAAGFSLHLANRVVVGHLQEVIVWPGKELEPVYQTVAKYEDEGVPTGVRR